MKRIVTEHLICKHCLNADQPNVNARGMVWCSSFEMLVANHNPWCDSWIANAVYFPSHRHICLENDDYESEVQ